MGFGVGCGCQAVQVVGGRALRWRSAGMLHNMHGERRPGSRAQQGQVREPTCRPGIGSHGHTVHPPMRCCEADRFVRRGGAKAHKEAAVKAVGNVTRSQGGWARGGESQHHCNLR